MSILWLWFFRVAAVLLLGAAVLYAMTDASRRWPWAVCAVVLGVFYVWAEPQLLRHSEWARYEEPEPMIRYLGKERPKPIFEKPTHNR